LILILDGVTPAHTDWLPEMVDPVFGCAVTTAVIGTPLQEGPTGVIVNVTGIGAVVALINEPLILPVPLEAIPVTRSVLLRVQLKVVPVVLLVNTTGAMVAPEQTDCDDGVATAFGARFTTTLPMFVGPAQPLAVGVAVNTTVTATAVTLVRVPLMFPVPLAAIPGAEAV
jgi:hypothetical protein